MKKGYSQMALTCALSLSLFVHHWFVAKIVKLMSVLPLHLIL